MKRFLLLSLFLSFTLNASFANVPVIKTGGGGFTFGYGSQNLQAFHMMTGLPSGTVNGRQLTLGVSGNRIYRNRLMTGISANIMIGDRVKTDSLSYKFSGMSGSVDIGYVLYQTEHRLFFPSIGVGLNNFSVKQKKIKNENPNPIVSNADRAISIYNTGVHADFALNIRFIGNRNYEKTYHSAVMTGLKIGYMVGINSSTWRYTGGSITKGTPFAARMPYIQLIIGGFGSRPVRH